MIPGINETPVVVNMKTLPAEYGELATCGVILYGIMVWPIKVFRRQGEAPYVRLPDCVELKEPHFSKMQRMVLEAAGEL